jgi:hypothetical protein
VRDAGLAAADITAARGTLLVVAVAYRLVRVAHDVFL